ncbi:hypothetical protein BJ508DRAFT_381184 [Ascobolus immersus RN42]|uniref:Uncharacterized protein n=1 Tax=Ascobolus immersus RN42 TaxID=1160509 RepID=A0A3N4HGG7_ASCIM|nr:hypothetical protein BJ508DRAFT_381184 [Ascobolus immersus RN42]
MLHGDCCMAMFRNKFTGWRYVNDTRDFVEKQSKIYTIVSSTTQPTQAHYTIYTENVPRASDIKPTSLTSHLHHSITIHSNNQSINPTSIQTSFNITTTMQFLTVSTVLTLLTTANAFSFNIFYAHSCNLVPGGGFGVGCGPGIPSGRCCAIPGGRTFGALQVVDEAGLPAKYTIKGYQRDRCPGNKGRFVQTSGKGCAIANGFELTSAKWWPGRSYRSDVSGTDVDYENQECEEFAPNTVLLPGVNSQGVKVQERYEMPEDSAKVYEYLDAKDEEGLRAYLSKVGAKMV